jgi:ketosteroid isomerase-like protein
MNNRLVLAVLILVVCVAFSCAKHKTGEANLPAASVEADAHAVRAALDQWVQLYNAGHYETLISTLYADDAILMAPSVPICRGREAILLGYMKDAEVNDEHVDTTVVEDVRISGDLAVASGWDAGTTTARAGGSPETFSVKWLMVMTRQQDGIWRFIYEVWNDNGTAGRK